jgi:hypothetical protein
MLIAPQPAAQCPRRADPPAVHRGPAARGGHADPRHRQHLPQRQRPRREEGAAAARQERVQPVLREQHAHAHHLRDRGQAAVADVINLDIAKSSASKGESLLDTIANLSAMHADMFVVRHSESGAPYLIAQHCAPHVHVVNAGDGRHAHPTQGLLDMYTIRHFKRDFTQLSVAMVGDIVHSRVARSDIHA